jgi:mono/diheme cytochrome c family protein
MKAFIVGLILGIALVVLGVFGYFVSGSAPVATSASPIPFEKFLATKALHAKIAQEMPKSVPIPVDEPNLLAGARVYRDNCAVCHGLPGQAATAISQGMFPRPPELLRGKGVTDDPAGETYWKVVNGIRLSGMPGFRQALSDTQAWQVSVMLANAEKLPSSAQAELSSPAPQPSVK